MTLLVSCPVCASQIPFSRTLAGKSLNCPKCLEEIDVSSLQSLDTSVGVPKAASKLPATAKQKQFAKDLGIVFSADIDRQSLSLLIDEAIAHQDDVRYEYVNSISEKENGIREELRAEILSECDEDDPRLSVASIEQILQAFAEKDIGAVLLTYEYGTLGDSLDLMGKNIVAHSTDDLDAECMKRVVSSLGLTILEGDHSLGTTMTQIRKLVEKNGKLIKSVLKDQKP